MARFDFFLVTLSSSHSSFKPDSNCLMKDQKHAKCRMKLEKKFKFKFFKHCLPCPAKSSSSSGHVKTVCDCLPDYYRLASESPDYPCTAPPSQPRNLRVTARYNGATGDSVVLEWNEPASLGGRKELRYRIRCLSCPSKATFFPDTATFTGTKIKIHGLEQDMKYKVEIYAENDISASIQHNVRNYATIEILTKYVLKASLRSVEIDGIQNNGVTISWKRPTLRNSDDFEYEVSRFTLIHLLYFTILNLNPQYRYSFKVRALTFHEIGTWTHPLYYKVGYGILPETQKVEDSVSNTSTTTRSKGNRKHFSDCDGLDSYKTGNIGVSDVKKIPENFLVGAPLIQYGSHPSGGYYGNTRIKSYVDPAAYEDPNQALLEFANNIDPNLIHITEVIGSGEFGEVCKGILQPCPKMDAYAKTIAIKTLKPGSSDKAKADFLMEASIMGQFQHENVIRLIGVVTKSEPVMIVTEFMENGSLDQFLRKHDNGQLQIIQILEMLRGIAAGMKYLTDKGYVHRDLAARNVLVDTELNCKIADFGLSRGLEGCGEQEYTTNGGKIPVRWTAPEAITHRKFTASSDVWSFGVVMWEVCSFGERPYWEWTNQKVISEITAGYRLPAPMDTPASLHKLMLRCWDIDRFRRPTFAQILQILEDYCRHPDLVYVDPNSIDVATNVDKIPLPPPCMPPPVPLSEFLMRVGLSHCCKKLNLAGIRSVADLTHHTQIDLINCGLSAEDAQRLQR
uniref:receptor protein-tyrosine kinase n=1 Tax=Syphacia muris TaxID=451379 RepID=A0A0N5ANS5_9BILA